MEILENVDRWRDNFVAGWLAHYKLTGEFDWKQYPRPRNRLAPAGEGVDLRASRLMLITSAGCFLRASQTPFDAANPLGDYTIRLVPSATPLDALEIAHDHYSHRAIDRDRQVLVPLRHLEALVDQGIIGELAPSMVSFMGYQPDLSRIVDEMIPVIIRTAQRQKVRAALLVPA